MTKRQWESSGSNNLTYECKQVWRRIESCNIRAKTVNLSQMLNGMFVNSECWGVRNRNMKAVQGGVEQVDHSICPTVTIKAKSVSVITFAFAVSFNPIHISCKLFTQYSTFAHFIQCSFILLTQADATHFRILLSNCKFPNIAHKFYLSPHGVNISAWPSCPQKAAAVAVVVNQAGSK